MTFADAERYRASYAAAIARLAKEAKGGVKASPGISVKLSALYPRYDFFHAEAAKAALVPMVRELALAASRADIHFTIDAEEAERLELSLDMIEALVADDTLFANGWQGFGLALQAYQKRAVPLVDWVVALARRHDRRLMVRLVKGAYWDTEIKLSQVGGYSRLPGVHPQGGDRRLVPRLRRQAARRARTRSTPPSPRTTPTRSARSCALARRRAANSSSSGCTAWARTCTKCSPSRRAIDPTRVRIYAPVGGHKDLLAYLVRRLLENGANSASSTAWPTPKCRWPNWSTDPVRDLAALEPQPQSGDPAAGRHLPGPQNSARRRSRRSAGARAVAGGAGDAGGPRMGCRADRSSPGTGGERARIRSPQDERPGRRPGALCRRRWTSTSTFSRAVAAQPGWDALGG